MYDLSHLRLQLQLLHPQLGQLALQGLGVAKLSLLEGFVTEDEGRELLAQTISFGGGGIPRIEKGTGKR
jgi:hypothetical protein